MRYRCHHPLMRYLAAISGTLTTLVLLLPH